jgi:hypothetical protein
MRAGSGEFLAEGPQAVREALAVGAALEVFATARFDDWRGSAGDAVWHHLHGSPGAGTHTAGLGRRSVDRACC